MSGALLPYLFPLGAALAIGVMASTVRAYSPSIRATLRDALEL